MSKKHIACYIVGSIALAAVMMAVMPIVISKSSDYIYKKFYADKYTPEYTDDDDDYPEIVRTCELEKEDGDGEF